MIVFLKGNQFCLLFGSAHNLFSILVLYQLYFQKRHTSARACGAIIFSGLRQRLRRKYFRVVERALAGQIL